MATPRFATSFSVFLLLLIACIGFLANPVDGARRYDRVAVPGASAVADFDGDGYPDLVERDQLDHSGR